MRLSFCTYCDENYLPRALALVESLREHAAGFQIYLLALTEQCAVLLEKLQVPEIIVVSIRELESWDPELANIKDSRSKVEYYFTLSPCFPRYLLAKYPFMECITYLDSDLFFYSKPQIILDQLETKSIAIVGHRYPHGDSRASLYGRFNVGWISFRNDETGRRCLEDWRRQCLEWCFDYPSEGRFADQKYLDAWPETYSGVLEVEHPGANLALWNLNRHKISQAEDGSVLVDGIPLIFFHFHGIKASSQHFVEVPFKDYAIPVPLRRLLIRKLFLSYLKILLRFETLLGQQGNVTPSLASIRIMPTLFSSATGWRQSWRRWLSWWRPRRAALLEASLIKIPRADGM